VTSSMRPAENNVANHVVIQPQTTKAARSHRR
jgi:hypothetical protein